MPAPCQAMVSGQLLIQAEQLSLQAPIPLVTHTALQNPGDAQLQSVITYFEEQYDLKSCNSICIPGEVQLSPTPLLGQLAEKAVLDKLKTCPEDIPGLRIITFHDTRVTDRINKTSKDSIREVDNMVLAEYQGQYFAFMFETKCNENISRSVQTRKKAIQQLKHLKAILETELRITIENLQFHTMWPNMAPTESCLCGVMHPTFTKLRPNPEPAGFHIFKDSFLDNSFSDWFKTQVSDPSKGISKHTFESLLAHFTLLSIPSNVSTSW